MTGRTSRARAAALTVLTAATLTACAAAPSATGASEAAGAGTPASAAPSASASGLDDVATPAWVGMLVPSGAATGSCTASALDTPGHDLIVSAAHCVSGTGAGLEFIPAATGGQEPYGRWRVVAVYVDDAWAAGSDLDDFAVMRVEPEVAASDHGGAPTALPAGLPVGDDPAPGTEVTVTGYGNESSSARSCTARTDRRSTPQGEVAMFPCEGYVGGTSGSPWVTSHNGSLQLVGVIGGYHAGGCRSAVSYSSPVSHLADLLADVEDGMAPSVVPTALADGCGS